jgi:hypothetical protein
LALEHSPARPDFSHAVQAGNLPSHFFELDLASSHRELGNKPLSLQLYLYTLLDFGHGLLRDKVICLHLEQAETGLDTLKSGVSAALGPVRVISLGSRYGQDSSGP